MLSIIVPMYNCELFIEECLESIYKCNKKYINNTEIILVDDGSKDETLSICNKFINKHKNMKINIISIENHGVSYARNLGIENSTGKYIMFLDSDDYLSSNSLDIIFENLDENNDIVFFSKTLDENLSKEQMILKLSGYGNKGVGISGPYSKVFKKKFLEKNKINFDTNLINGEDMIFCIESLIKSQKFLIVKESFYEYRIHIGSATQRFDDKIIETDRKFYDKLHILIEKSTLERNMRDEIYSYSLCNAIFLLSSRISYIKNPFLVIKKYKLFLHIEPYKSASVKNTNIDNKKKLIVILNKMNLILVSDFILKMYHLKKSKTTNKKDYFVSI